MSDNETWEFPKDLETHERNSQRFGTEYDDWAEQQAYLAAGHPDIRPDLAYGDKSVWDKGHLDRWKRN